MSGTLWIGLLLLLGVLALELGSPTTLLEGFQAILPTQVVIPKTPKQDFLGNMITRRGDVGPNLEAQGYTQDRRYFADYTDVQRYAANNDFCRMVSTNKADPGESFFACALAGTAGTSPVGFRTKSVKEGLRLSRDDYMSDILKDGRNAYCRILKDTDGTYQPLCLRALDTGFNWRDETDPNPPPYIETLLSFYQNCKMWLRLRDDMVDYVGNAFLQYAGKLTINESPRPAVTKGLVFNGRDQFLRLGDADDLTLGYKINLRTIRAFSFWIRFDAFTNNAHIFDFGDGPGKNNVFFGILGKGDPDAAGEALRPTGCETTVPTGPSGAQWCPELTPQDLLATSAGNVDDFSCPKPEVLARKLEPSTTKQEVVLAKNPKYATLLYEVWDNSMRKMQIKIPRGIQVKKWTQIVITATTNDAMRPDIEIWANGEKIGQELAGFLPQNRMTTHNYIGKSNWTNDDSLYDIRDELFQGALFDFRMYSAPLSKDRITRMYEWGQGMLGLI